MHEIGELARRILGEPNRRLSTKTQLRFGTNGSLSVELCGQKAGSWYDHENNVGGDGISLVKNKLGLGFLDAKVWLENAGFTSFVNGKYHSFDRKEGIVDTYDYCDETGALLFQVVRFEPKTFRQRRRPAPDEEPTKIQDGWVWSTKGVRQVPYRLPELLERPEGAAVWIVEGEKDVNRLVSLGLVATCNAGGAGKGDWTSWKQWFDGSDIIIIPDNDEAGNKHAEMVRDALCGRIVNINAKDISDWFDRGHTLNELLKLSNPSDKTRSLFDIWNTEYAKLEQLVSGLIVPGLTLLCAKPKVGKSWMLLDIGLAIAAGGIAMGSLKCVKAECLLIMLEDSERRLKDRIMTITQEAEAPSYLRHCHASTVWPRGRDGINAIEQWLDLHNGVRLIGIDVLAKFRTEGTNGAAYQEDYDCLSALQMMAMKRDVAIVVPHHLRKADADDPLDLVSGTLGLTGAADHIIVITGNQDDGYKLVMRGRDLSDVAWDMSFARGQWEIIGDTERKRRLDTVERIERDRKIREMHEQGMTQREIALSMGVSNGLVAKVVGTKC